jgi:hypothetical protein
LYEFSTRGSCPECSKSEKPGAIVEAPHADGPAIFPVWRETGQTFSTRERAALEWAEMLTLICESHAPEEIDRDIAAHFTETEMVDLTIAIGLMNVFNRIAIGFGCDPASS